MEIVFNQSWIKIVSLIQFFKMLQKTMVNCHIKRISQAAVAMVYSLYPLTNSCFKLKMSLRKGRSRKNWTTRLIKTETAVAPNRNTHKFCV